MILRGRLFLVVALLAVSCGSDDSSPKSVAEFVLIGEHPTGEGPWSLAVADLDGDGDADVVVANRGDDPTFGNTISVLLGNGNGDFEAAVDFDVGERPAAIAVADVNGDTILDVGVANANDGTISILLGDGTGLFLPKLDFPTGDRPHGLAFADFDEDSLPDVAVANQITGTVSILFGVGTEAFPLKADLDTGQGPKSVTTADMNLDGHIDIVVAHANTILTGSDVEKNTVSVLLGDGAGGFPAQNDLELGTNNQIVAVDDLDGDSLPDLAVLHCAECSFITNADTLSVVRGDGTGGFGARTDYSVPFASTLEIADADGDGIVDLAVATSIGAEVIILLGDGSGGFTEWAQAVPIGDTTTAAVGEFDSDGRPDIVTANHFDDSISIYLRRSVLP